MLRSACGARSALFREARVRISSARTWASALLGFVFLVCLCAPSPASAQASMQTILANGPVSNRFNIVFLSEGYTGSQMPQFLVDATNAVKALLSHQPYLEYSNYFNAFAIKTNSVESGSDHPTDHMLPSTPTSTVPTTRSGITHHDPNSAAMAREKWTRCCRRSYRNATSGLAGERHDS